MSSSMPANQASTKTPLSVPARMRLYRLNKKSGIKPIYTHLSVTDRVRMCRLRKKLRTEKPIKPAPISAAEHMRNYRLRKKQRECAVLPPVSASATNSLLSMIRDVTQEFDSQRNIPHPALFYRYRAKHEIILGLYCRNGFIVKDVMRSINSSQTKTYNFEGFEFSKPTATAQAQYIGLTFSKLEVLIIMKHYCFHTAQNTQCDHIIF